MNETVEKGQTTYGTSESPLEIGEARLRIRNDFLLFAEMIMQQLALPEGHIYGTGPALSPNQQLSWHLGCEIQSASSGLSLYGHRSSRDEADPHQLHIEVRYFHPELHYRPTKRSKPRVSRPYNNGFSAHLWVDQGRPFWGMSKSLIEGAQFCRNMPTPQAMANEVINRLRQAFERRAVPTAGAAPSFL